MADRAPKAGEMRGATDSRALFARPWVFARAVPALGFLPPEGPAEIAFAGRSNVGKSTLVNALVGQKGLARASNAPGRTQMLNFFLPEGHRSAPPPLALVDLPGYGFARAPRTEADRWTRLVFDYLRARAALKRVYVLIDARRGVKPIDTEVFGRLDAAAVSWHAVLTKTDKIGAAALAPLVERTAKEVSRHPAAFPSVLATSAQKALGLDGLRRAIFEAAGG